MKILKKYACHIECVVLFSLLILCGDLAADNKHFVIIIPSRNNSEWVDRTLGSVLSQTVGNWHAIYLNDASTDDTKEKVEQFIRKHNAHDKITLINNETRQGALANIVKAVYLCNNWDVIVTLDGDDWFAGDHVLQKLNDAYADENVWMTYGSYQEFPSGRKGIFAQPIPADVIADNAYRKYGWKVSHLRTFYAWLFKLIKIEDLKIDGEFFMISGDLAHIFPVIEMTGGRFKYITDTLYVYNVQTPHNDHKKNRMLQQKMGSIIKSRAPYQPLKGVPAQYMRH